MPARPMVFAAEYIHLLHSGHPFSVLPMEIHFERMKSSNQCSSDVMHQYFYYG